MSHSSGHKNSFVKPNKSLILVFSGNTEWSFNPLANLPSLSIYTISAIAPNLYWPLSSIVDRMILHLLYLHLPSCQHVWIFPFGSVKVLNKLTFVTVFSWRFSCLLECYLNESGAIFETLCGSIEEPNGQESWPLVFAQHTLFAHEYVLLSNWSKNDALITSVPLL